MDSASKIGRRHDVNIYSRFHGYAYDGIWTMARAIDAVERDSKLINETLVDFKYKLVMVVETFDSQQYKYYYTLLHFLHPQFINNRNM